VGGSLLETDRLEDCRRLLEDAGGKLMLPRDVVVAQELVADADTRTVPATELPDGWKGLDIGPDAVHDFRDAVLGAGTVFWNGPMGVFELAPFAEGTRGVAQAVASSDAFSVVGGGDSAAAVRQLGVPEDGFSHISTGGGASLEFLEGATLPGLAVLEDD
jgi:phosphoglycerate kinase